MTSSRPPGAPAAPGRDWKIFGMLGTAGLGCLAAAAAFLRNGNYVLGFVAGAFGLMLALAGASARKAVCPRCGGTMDVILVPGLGESRYNECRGCDEYFELAGGALRQMEPTHVAREPMFAVPIPWDDLRDALAPSLTPTATIKVGGAERALTDKWPAICCVCAGAADRRERIAQTVLKGPDKVGSLLEEKITMTAQVPHCHQHSQGARFGREPRRGWMLKFRSYAFRNEFRRLNANDGGAK